MVPTAGAEGISFTVSVYKEVAAAHGAPSGLFVVTVIITIFPASAATGVYVKANGELLVETGDTEPAPLSVIVTAVAVPPKVLALTVIGEVPHVLPELLLKETVGGSTHPHETSKAGPVVVHPEEFLTVILCVPLDTPVKEVLD